MFKLMGAIKIGLMGIGLFLSLSIPSKHASTRQARYWVSHVGGYTLKVINQSAYWDQWVSLGTYRFAGTDQDFLSLADVTYEPYLARDVAWDAVKWVAR